jgi:hypothetical protein
MVLYLGRRIERRGCVRETDCRAFASAYRGWNVHDFHSGLLQLLMRQIGQSLADWQRHDTGVRRACEHDFGYVRCPGRGGTLLCSNGHILLLLLLCQNGGIVCLYSRDLLVLLLLLRNLLLMDLLLLRDRELELRIF